MKHLFAIFLLFGLISACNKANPYEREPEADTSTIRSTAQGQVIGSVTFNGAHQWTGIPFAQAPIGDLRWRAPKNPASHEGVLEALDPTIRCIQKARDPDTEKTGTLLGSEDCLVLNIWAPAFAPDAVPTKDEKLPVMVFIHGGSNIWGYGGQYDSQVIANRHDLVVVSINYRMGPLGWFSQASLQDQAVGGMQNSPNYANLDMIKALEWVQANIASFGGNPDQVTIFGESAGGQNVAALLAIPQAQGLFDGAIIQSGYFTSRGVKDQREGVDISVGWHFKGDDAIVADLNPPTGATGPELAAFLRKQSPADIFAAAAWTDGEPESPLIIRDGILIGQQGLEVALDQAPHPIVPVITGTNRDELKLFNIADPTLTKKAFGFLPRARNKILYDNLSRQQSAMWRVRSVDQQARRLTTKNDNPVFAYRFDWDEEGRFFGSDFAHLLGAAHAMELPFVFGFFESFPIGGKQIFPDSGKAQRDALSRNMMSYWAEFAYTGAPGRGRNNELPQWGSWQQATADGQLMILDTSADGDIRLSQETLTIGGVYEQLALETKDFSDADRCVVFLGVTGWYPETKDQSGRAHISNC